MTSTVQLTWVSIDLLSPYWLQLDKIFFIILLKNPNLAYQSQKSKKTKVSGKDSLKFILNVIATIETNTTIIKNIPEPIKVSKTNVWSKISGEIFCALASIKYIKKLLKDMVKASIFGMMELVGLGRVNG